MRNSETGGLRVYNIANNQITGTALLGTVGLEWQFAGVAQVNAPGVKLESRSAFAALPDRDAAEHTAARMRVARR